MSNLNNHLSNLFNFKNNNSDQSQQQQQEPIANNSNYHIGFKTNFTETDNPLNSNTNNNHHIISNIFTDIHLNNNRMTDRINYLGFDHLIRPINNNNNNFENDLNDEQTNQIIKSIKISSDTQDSNNDDQENLIKAFTGVNVRFKDAFEGILQSNRIENFSKNQDFNEIVRKHSSTNLFVDKEFRASNESVYFTNKFFNYLRNNDKISYRSNQIMWKRAKEMFPNAHFVLDENEQYLNLRRINQNNYKRYFQTTDLDQGALGNCWFISGATGIIQNYSLLQRVVPFDNSLEDSEYTGAFHFRFWVYGEWKDIVIDDYLPIGPDNKLIFSKNRDNPNEFWCALLEKAYAKLCGSYEVLDGGFTSDALIDMSGGIEESFNLKKVNRYTNTNVYNNDSDNTDKFNKDSFWHLLVNARKKQSVIGSNIDLLSTDFTPDVKMSNGLVRGHAYIITKIAEVDCNGRNYRIIRLYNPWGNEVEWNGEWSDKSRIWKLIDEQTKNGLELKIENDGEFWMSYDDWLANFDNCQICNLTPDTIHDISEESWKNARQLSNIFSMWQAQYFHGAWVNSLSAGGRGEPNREKFWTNPQFTFVINNADLIKDDMCWVVIGLMQKYTRRKRMVLQNDSAEEYIQFRVFKVRDMEAFFKLASNGESVPGRYLERVGSTGSYINKREITARFALKQGAYIIIPSCYDEDVEGEFLLRIFTEKPLSKKTLRSSVNSSRLSFENRQSSYDNLPDDSIIADLNGLSIGASNIFNNFLNKSVDYSKSTIKKKKYLDQNSDGSSSKGKDKKPTVECTPM